MDHNEGHRVAAVLSGLISAGSESTSVIAPSYKPVTVRVNPTSLRVIKYLLPLRRRKKEPTTYLMKVFYLESVRARWFCLFQLLIDTCFNCNILNQEAIIELKNLF